MKISKTKGIMELLLAILCPVIAISFVSLQDDRVFGGTKWEFFIHSATVDGDIWPWIIFVLLIVEIICIIRVVYLKLNSTIQIDSDKMHEYRTDLQ